MKLFLLLSILLTLTACKHDNYVKDSLSDEELSKVSGHEKDSLYIVRSIKVFVEGIAEENINKVLSIYHSDYVYSYPTRQRTLIEIKKDYQRAFGHRYLFVDYPYFKVSEIKVIGESAYVVVDWNFTISYQKNKKIVRNRFYRDIQVWQKQDDDSWLMIRTWQFPLP